LVVWLYLLNQIQNRFQTKNYVKFSDYGIDDITSDVKERWYTFAEERYVFGVLNETDNLALETAGEKILNSITSLFGADKKGSPFTDFPLPITPQEITQTENFAVSIRPTHGGTVLQHSGNKYKDLTIAGTTGVHPFKGITGADRYTGAAIFQPDNIKYRSGYEVFIHFRNWIKSYHQVKAQAGNIGLRMVFKNYKDWEFLIVEPLKFTMKRDASRPLLYNYQIQFKVLGHYAPPKAPNGVLEYIDKGLNQVSRVLEVSRGIIKKREEFLRSVAGEVDGITEMLRKANLATKAIKGGDVFANDMGPRTKENFLSQGGAKDVIKNLTPILDNFVKQAKDFEKRAIDMETAPADPMALVANINSKLKNPNLDAKKELANLEKQMGDLLRTANLDAYPLEAKQELLLEQQKAALVSKQEISNNLDTLRNFKDRFASSLNLSNPYYDSIYGVISTSNQLEVAENPDAQFESLYGLQQAEKSMEIILSSDEFFDTAKNLYGRNTATSGAENIGQGIFSFPNPNTGIREGIVPTGATLEDIAFSELGDSSRWTELAELNGLKPPYIDDSNSESKKINYTVKSSGFYDPTDIQSLTPSDYYLIAEMPTALSAWTGKENFITEFLGGDVTVSSNWRFLLPPLGTVIKVIDRQLYLEKTEAGWVEVDFTEIQTTEVLKPGDRIKIPSSQIPTSENKIRGPRDNAITNGLSASEKSLAVDINLNESGDLDLNPSGDLNLITGAENMAQAIVLKLLYELGDLKKHREIGTQLTIGGKLPNLANIRTQISSTLLQDQRIRDVRNINLRNENSVIEVTFDVFLKDIADPIPVTIPV